MTQIKINSLVIVFIVLLHINVNGKPTVHRAPKHHQEGKMPIATRAEHARKMPNQHDVHRHSASRSGHKITKAAKSTESVKKSLSADTKVKSVDNKGITKSKNNNVKSKISTLHSIGKTAGKGDTGTIGASTEGKDGAIVTGTGEEKKFDVDNYNNNDDKSNGGGYGTVDNSWEKKLNAALSEEDHMVDALHKKTDSVLTQEVKSSLPKSFMSQLLSPTILKDMSSVASPIDFGGDSPPIPPEPTISNRRPAFRSDISNNNNKKNSNDNNENMDNKSRRIGPVHADVSSEHLEPVIQDDSGSNYNSGDGGGGMIRLPQGVPGSVDEYSSGQSAPPPPPPPPALPTSTSGIKKSSSSVNIDIGPTIIKVDVIPSDTVGDVALRATELAEKNGGYEYDPGPLKYHGELLEDNLKFSSYSIPKNAKIRMLPHPRGTVVRHSNGVETKLRQTKGSFANNNDNKCLDFLPVRCIKWLASLPCAEEVRLAPIFLKQLRDKLPQTTAKHSQGLFKIWQVCPQHCSRCDDVMSSSNRKGRGWWKKVKSAIADTDDVVERHYDSFFLVFVSLLGVAGFCGLCLCCGFGNGGGICSSICCCCYPSEKSVEAPFQYSYSGYDFEDDDMDDSMMYDSY
jgi:hypothetical protein